MDTMQPLQSLTILVTRPQPQAAVLSALIAQLGGNPYCFPAIQIVPVAVDWSQMACFHADFIIFTSAHAVIHSASIHTQLTGTLIAVGEGTAAALQQHHLPVDCTSPPPFGTESLLTLPELQQLAGKKVILLRGVEGRRLLADTLRERGARLLEVPCYQRVLPQTTPQQIQNLLAAPLDIIICTSNTSMDHLFILVGDAGKTLLQSTPWLVISQRMVQAAKKYALSAQIIVSQPSNDAIIGTLIDWANNKNLSHGER